MKDVLGWWRWRAPERNSQYLLNVWIVNTIKHMQHLKQILAISFGIYLISTERANHVHGMQATEKWRDYSSWKHSSKEFMVREQKRVLFWTLGVSRENLLFWTENQARRCESRIGVSTHAPPRIQFFKPNQQIQGRSGQPSYGLRSNQKPSLLFLARAQGHAGLTCTVFHQQWVAELLRCTSLFSPASRPLAPAASHLPIHEVCISCSADQIPAHEDSEWLFSVSGPIETQAIIFLKVHALCCFQRSFEATRAQTISISFHTNRAFFSAMHSRNLRLSVNV